MYEGERGGGGGGGERGGVREREHICPGDQSGKILSAR